MKYCFPRKALFKFFLFFIVIAFLATLFYTHILGNWRWFLESRAKSRYENNYLEWARVFNICRKINANNRGDELIIRRYTNRSLLEGNVLNESGTYIADLKAKYPSLYYGMYRLEIDYIIIDDTSSEFALEKLPSKVFLTHYNLNVANEKKHRKVWATRLNDSVYIEKR